MNQKKYYLFLLFATFLLFINFSLVKAETDDLSSELIDVPEPGELLNLDTGESAIISQKSDSKSLAHRDECRIRDFMDTEKFKKRWLDHDDDPRWRHYIRDSECKKIVSAKLYIWAYDVDSGPGPYWEHDRVYVDGHFVGELTGKNNKHSISEFDIDPAWLSDNKINVKVDVDATYGHPDHADGKWIVQLGWSVLVVKMEWLPPVADFKADPTEGIGPLTVHFQNKSECASDYFWDFGDGNYSTKKHPKHTYNTVQKYYSVTLTARGCGGEDTLIKNNYIVVNKPVQVNFEATPLVSMPGDTVWFTNHSGGNANHFLWDFGDGSTLETRSDIKNRHNPSHVYSEAGEYAVTLKAWGNGGDDWLTIPGLVYIDADHQYLNMTVHSHGATYPGEDWQNAIDHDIFGAGSGVAAAADDAWAVFTPADDSFAQLHKLRILVDPVEPNQLVTNLTKSFELWAAPDETNFEQVLSGELTQRDGLWEIFELETPVTTKFVKVVLTAARGTKAKYREISEIQFLGMPVSGSELMKPKAVFASDAQPTSFRLEQNYPNPFNPETVIRYQLPEAAQVTLAIYNIQGQLIRTLVSQNFESGIYQQVWDGRNQNGQIVGTGIYIYKLQAQTNDNLHSFIKKMTLMK